MDGEPPGNIKKEFFERFVFIHTPDPSEEGRSRLRVFVCIGCSKVGMTFAYPRPL